jgi:GR25 family glycosyltransferase involved in LPS biosynthesis
MFSLVVSLARVEERRRGSVEILQAAGMEYEIVEAHDGLVERDLPRHRECWNIRPTEVATFYSHCRALRRLLELGLPWGLILEDDFKFLPGFDLAEVERALPKSFAMVSVHHAASGEWGPQVAEAGAVLNRVRLLGLGTLGYVASRRFAREFLDACVPCKMPVDHQYRVLSGDFPKVGFYTTARPLVGGRGLPSTL